MLVSEARQAREARLDLSKRRERRSPDGDDAPAIGDSFQSARAARELAQAKLAQLELDQRLGNLLDKGEVLAEAAAKAQQDYNNGLRATPQLVEAEIASVKKKNRGNRGTMTALDEAEIPVGVREAARQLGLAHSTISKQLAAGVIPNRGTPGQPLVLVSEARQAREARLDLSKRRERRSPDGDDAPAIGDSFQSARAARELAQAKLAQLELDQRLGNLLDKGEVVDAFFTLGARLRERTEASAVEITQRFGADVGAAVGEELRKILASIAEDFERLSQDSTGEE